VGDDATARLLVAGLDAPNVFRTVRGSMLRRRAMVVLGTPSSRRAEMMRNEVIEITP